MLRLADRTMRFPAYCAPALRAGARRRAAPGRRPAGLDDDADRLVLARRLLREALAVPAGPVGAPARVRTAAARVG